MDNLSKNDISEFYKNNYLATVEIKNGKVVVLGGMSEKRMLRFAKNETQFCYVKVLPGGKEAKLKLAKNEWEPEEI